MRYAHIGNSNIIFKKGYDGKYSKDWLVKQHDFEENYFPVLYKLCNKKDITFAQNIAYLIQLIRVFNDPNNEYNKKLNPDDTRPTTADPESDVTYTTPNLRFKNVILGIKSLFDTSRGEEYIIRQVVLDLIRLIVLNKNEDQQTKNKDMMENYKTNFVNFINKHETNATENNNLKIIHEIQNSVNNVEIARASLKWFANQSHKPRPMSGGKRAHKSTDFARLAKADVKPLLMRQPGIIEELKALALSKGVMSYTTKENLVDAVLRKAKVAELRGFAKKHVKA